MSEFKIDIEYEEEGKRIVTKVDAECILKEIIRLGVLKVDQYRNLKDPQTWKTNGDEHEAFLLARDFGLSMPAAIFLHSLVHDTNW
jgi:hypothetical protein